MSRRRSRCRRPRARDIGRKSSNQASLRPYEPNPPSARPDLGAELRRIASPHLEVLAFDGNDTAFTITHDESSGVVPFGREPLPPIIRQGVFVRAADEGLSCY